MTLILGHRGARKYAPENSVASFNKAIELKLDGVEFDVLSTSDGIPVVVHDDNLKKLSGKHIHVHDTPYASIKDIDIGSNFNPYFTGEKIPTLKETLDVFKGTNLVLNIEIKHQHNQHKDFLKHLIEVMVGSGLETGRIVISSFRRNILYKFGRMAPQFQRMLLHLPSAFFFLDVFFSANVLRVGGINPHIKLLSKPLMYFAKSRNWRVFVWGANEPAEIRKAVVLGVDGIITDEPMLAR